VYVYVSSKQTNPGSLCSELDVQERKNIIDCQKGAKHERFAVLQVVLAMHHNQ